MGCVPPRSVRLDGEIQGARHFSANMYVFNEKREKKNMKMWRIWSAMRDAGLRFCQNGAMLVRIDLDVMETHKKALKHKKYDI